MTSKKQKFSPYSLIGKSIDTAVDAIQNDTDYKGSTAYYWISVSSSFDNISHYIRFPYGSDFYMEYENGIITKVY